MDKGAADFIGGQNNQFLIEFSNGETAVLGECGDYLYWNGAFYRCASGLSLFLNTLFNVYAQMYFVPYNER